MVNIFFYNKLTTAKTQYRRELHKFAARTSCQSDNVRQSSQQTGNVRVAVQCRLELDEKHLLVRLAKQGQGNAASLLQQQAEIPAQDLQRRHPDQRRAAIIVSIF